jgi:nitroreductase
VFDDANQFFFSRHSCRNFDTERLLDLNAVREVVAVAQSAPSVCNRQGGRLHYLSDPQDIDAALALQSGNRGFRQTVRHLAIITADRRAFSEATERNQGWIDGGLFAMTFVWALHARGYASCMLNWSMGVTATRRLREAIGIPDYEDVICMVAFGHAATDSRRARSERLAPSTVLIEH